MKKRRSLTTPVATPDGDVPATRRGGTRREVTARVTLTPKAGKNPATLDGWALNVSRGGVRVIVEGRVDLGAEFEIALQAESGLDVTRSGRVVWVQDEPDGEVVGIEFVGPSPSESPGATGAGEADSASASDTPPKPTPTPTD